MFELGPKCFQGFHQCTKRASPYAPELKMMHKTYFWMVPSDALKIARLLDVFIQSPDLTTQACVLKCHIFCFITMLMKNHFHMDIWMLLKTIFTELAGLPTTWIILTLYAGAKDRCKAAVTIVMLPLFHVKLWPFRIAQGPWKSCSRTPLKYSNGTLASPCNLQVSVAHHPGCHTSYC